MSEQQFYSTLLLLAIAISTSLQVISLQEKKRWVGCVAVAFILGLIPAVLFTPFTKQITEIPQKKQPTGGRQHIARGDAASAAETPGIE